MAKRILSLFLCLALMIGMVPAFAFSTGATEVAEKAAANEVIDAAIFFSDLHTNKSDYKESTIKSIMGGTLKAGVTFSSVTSCGDAFSVNEDNSSSNGPYTGYTSKITASIRNGLGTVYNDIPVNYVWSDHDRCAVKEDGTSLLDKTSQLVYGAGADGKYGTSDDDNYYVYALSMGDLCSYDRYKAGFNTDSRVNSGFTDTVENAIAKFEADVAKLDKSKPLFIASHQPLFDNRNDNAWAEDWFDSINKVAENMDVAFFYGHNHKYDVATDYYYAKGSTMPVATMTGWKNYEIGIGYKPSCDLKPESKTLNFTHMCAGYMEPTSTGSYSDTTTRKGTVMVVTINKDSIDYETYDKNGLYTGQYNLDVNVKRDHAATEPENPGTTPDTPVVPETPSVFNIVVNDNIVGTISGVSEVDGNALADADKTLIEAKGYDAFVAYDVNATLLEVENATATLTFPIPEGWDTNRIVGISVEDGTVKEIPGTISDNNFSFEIDHFSAKGIALLAEGDTVTVDPNAWVEITAPTGGTTTYTYTLDTDGTLNANSSYIIVNNDNTNALDNNNINGVKSSTITSANNTNAKTTTRDYEWKIDDQRHIYTSISGKTYYLQVYRNSKSDYGVTLTTSVGSASIWTISFNNGYSVSAKPANNNTRYYLTSSGVSTSDKSRVRIYEYDPSADVTVGGTGGLYAAIVGATAYEVANGTELNGAIAEVKNGITAYKYEGSSKPTTAVTGTEISDNDLTVTITNYDGSKADNYTATITYKDTNKVLGTVTVTVKDAPSIKSFTVTPASATVNANTANASTVIGTINYIDANNNPGTADLTLGMLNSAEYKLTDNVTFANIDVTYAGITLNDALTLTVTGINNFPEYPDAGSVDLNKVIGDTSNFQNLGVAEVQLSTTGLPVKKGVDVIVMLDMSSSMTRCLYCNKDSGKCDTKTYGAHTFVKRLDELKPAMENLETALKASKNASDIKIAVADFHGFYNSGATARDTSDKMADAGTIDSIVTNKVYTGNNTVSAGAFISIKDLDVSDFTDGKNNANGYNDEYATKSGTNYDYAFDTIYRLGYAIQQENIKNGDTDRELYVIFMSDGAANQFNYYSTVGGDNSSNSWNKWLSGTMTDAELKSGNGGLLSCGDHAYYYDKSTGNQHRMANAIKGDPDVMYDVIRKSTSGLEGVIKTPEKDDTYYGKTNMYKLPGLGATTYTIAFGVTYDGKITPESAKHSLVATATSAEHYIEAEEEGALASAFDRIAGNIAYAAEDARFVDQMGDSFNLQMATTITKFEDTEIVGVFEDITTDITVSAYKIYTKADINASANDNITIDMLGQRIPNTEEVKEVIKFSADGTKAYTSVGGYTLPNGTTVVAYTVDAQGKPDFSKATNILVDNVIYAKNFWYNAGENAVAIEGVNIPTNTNSDGATFGSTNMLPAETFYWNLGTINEQEFVLSYYVSLEGAAKGKATAGSYKTNNYANLYYKNYLGNNVMQDVQTPTLTWESASLHYGFYLVNQSGQPIVNQTTGETGSFGKAVKISPKIFYGEILLNTQEGVDSEDTLSLNAQIIPDEYDIYDADASYTITIDSSGDLSQWVITKGDDKVNSTYVTDYRGNEYTNLSTSAITDKAGFDYSSTTVWFAVVWVPKAIDDTVVIDYGLPVDISVMANDQFGTNGKLVGIGKTDDRPTSDLIEGLYKTVDSDKFTMNSFNSTYGSVSVNGGKVRYTPATMEMPNYDRFTYEVEYDFYEYDGNGKPVTEPQKQYYYGNVTVIPATTIYYEDSFVTFTASNTKWKDATDANKPEGTVTQDEDRVGFYNRKEIDANNVYGTDSAYAEMSKYSLGSAKKVTVDANSYATASFTFYGTGFDVISLTSNQTGVLVVQVYDSAGTRVVSKVVDTYYGYTRNENGEWVTVANTTENDLYQIPVIKVQGLDYGSYNVVITASYFDTMNNVGSYNESGKFVGDGSYDLYLDAIRIYDPAGTTYSADGNSETTGNALIDDVIEKAYKEDKEGKPNYYELRNLIIPGNTFKDFTGTDDNKEYDTTKFKGAVFIDGVAENLSVDDYISYGPNNEVYLAKNQAVAFNITMDGSTADVQIALKVASGGSITYKINDRTLTTDSATDLYQSILTEAKRGTVTIENVGDGVLSITNIKITHDNYTVAPIDELWIDEASVANVFRMMRPPVAEEPEVDDTTSTPETDDTTTSEPETSEPEVNEPEEDDTTSSKPEKEEKPGKGEKPDKENKPGKDEKPDKENKPDKEEKPEKNEKPEKPGKDNQAQNNASAKDTVKTIVKAVANAVAKLLGKLFN